MCKFLFFENFFGKSILHVPDTGTRVLDNTRPFLCSSIVSFWIILACSGERKYHIFGQYWYTKNVPVLTNTGTFQYLGPEVYFFHFFVPKFNFSFLFSLFLTFYPDFTVFFACDLSHLCSCHSSCTAPSEYPQHWRMQYFMLLECNARVLNNEISLKLYSDCLRRESNFLAHCLVRVRLLHCIRVQLCNGYTRAYLSQWPNALKPKTYSLVENREGNQIKAKNRLICCFALTHGMHTLPSYPRVRTPWIRRCSTELQPTVA